MHADNISFVPSFPFINPCSYFTLSDKCADNEFACRNDYSCISELELCDGTEHCPDGSDEAWCSKLLLTLMPPLHIRPCGFYHLKNSCNLYDFLYLFIIFI